MTNKVFVSAGICVFLLVAIKRLMLSKFFGLMIVPTEDANCNQSNESESSLTGENIVHNKNCTTFFCTSDNGHVIPTHKFNIKPGTFKSGKKIGQEKTTVSLTMQPYKYKRRTDRGDILYLSCNGCEKKKKFLMVKARKVDNGYEIIEWPTDMAHKCSPPAINPLIDKFKEEVSRQIKLNPHQALPTLCDDLRLEFGDKLRETPDNRTLFLQMVPKFR